MYATIRREGRLRLTLSVAILAQVWERLASPSAWLPVAVAGADRQSVPSP